MGVVISAIVVFVGGPQLKVTGFTALVRDNFISGANGGTISTLLAQNNVSDVVNAISLVVVALTLNKVLVRVKVVRDTVGPLITGLGGPNHLVATAVFTKVNIGLFINRRCLSIVLPKGTFGPTFGHVNLSPLTLDQALRSNNDMVGCLVP